MPLRRKAPLMLKADQLEDLPTRIQNLSRHRIGPGTGNVGCANLACRVLFFLKHAIRLAEGHGAAGSQTQAIFAGGGHQHAITLDRQRGEAALPIAAGTSVGSHLNENWLRTAVQESVAELPRDLALGVIWLDRAAGRFEGMANDAAQCQATRLLVRGHRPPQLAHRVGYDFAIPKRSIAGDGTVVAKVGQKLIAAPVPGPFFEL